MKKSPEYTSAPSADKLLQGVSDSTLLNFLFDTPEDIPATHKDLPDAPSPGASKKTLCGAIEDNESLKMLRDELNDLYDQFFTQTKVCSSLLKLLEELETPNEASDIAELISLVYSEVTWLRWNDEQFVGATYEDELKWLNQTVAKVVGSQEDSEEPNQSHQPAKFI